MDVKTSFTQQQALSTGPVSTEPYISPAFFDLEAERVFRRAWLNMGRIEQLPEVGSYVVKDVEVCQASVLITRVSDGGVRAFHNVCSHRGNLVAVDPVGKASRFVCRYHGWTYKNSGELVGITDEPNFFGVDKKKCGLTPVAVDVWDGWIFINLSPEPEVSLAEFLGKMGEELRGIQYPNAHNSITIVCNLNANWKVIADAFAEGYHVPTIHPQTIAPSFIKAGNPFLHSLAIHSWGPHRFVSNPGQDPSYGLPDHAHVEKLYFQSLGSGSIFSTMSASVLEEFLKHPFVNPTKAKDWGADVTWFFPNFHLDVAPGSFWTHEFWPTSYNSTRWVAQLFLPEADDVETRLQQEHYAARFLDIMLEDLGNTERTQKGMETRAKPEVHLQDSEVLIRHSLHHIWKWVKAPTVAEALAED